MAKKVLIAVFLILLGVSPSRADDAGRVHFTIDAAKDVRPISRFIYGVNRPLDGPYAHLTLGRLGGNRWTAYNWVNNASNAGSDYHFQNDGFLGGGDAPGGAVGPFVERAFARDAGVVLTVPMTGYVAADKKGEGDVRDTGRSGPDYLKSRFRRSVARKAAPFTLSPDPAGEVVYQDEFVNWVKAKFATGANADRPIFFSLDNEPDLWSTTHAAIHPKPVTYEELIAETVDYAGAIKDVLPKAKVFGPANYGWLGFTRLQNAPDAANRDFQEVYLQRLAEAEKTHGRRLLDVLDVHWYPEAKGGGVRIIEPDTAPAVVEARLQAPRSLWDPTYAEPSWIAKDMLRGPVKLLPRLKDKIDRHYPGTLLAVTEYNYGGGDHISGAIAQADVLGILGRAGVFAACEWPLAKDESFIDAAFAIYRDFDGKKGTLGDTSVSATTDDVAATSIYASVDSADPARLVFVAINKTDHPLTADVSLEHVRPATRAETFQLTAARPAPVAAGAVRLSEPTRLTVTLPAYSVSTVRLLP